MSKTTLRKGKQDDKFSLAIREIQASQVRLNRNQILSTLPSLFQAANKKCFDCEQRGPTYINVTIGSFVCTKCSGMLRGINPPHRIKSISMSSFSADEVGCSGKKSGIAKQSRILFKGRDDEKSRQRLVSSSLAWTL